MKLFKHLLMLLTVGSLIASGCKSLNKTQKGAAIGVAGGAAVGGIIGKALGHTAVGAIAGAAVGGTVGAVVGRKMDKQAEEMKQVLGDAEVKRVGEGIVIEFKEKVLFGYDKSDLSSTAQQNLNKLIEVLKKYPDTNIEVLGNTDSVGSESYNQALSERRATAVGNYIQSNGISSSRVTSKGLGETDPRSSNSTEEGRADNRRVEFVITANEKMKSDAKQESGS